MIELPNKSPLYLQVRDQIVAGIAAGDWPVGDALPSEFELAQKLGVSQGTVRKGLDALVAEGVLIRRQGIGTFIADAPDAWGSAELLDAYGVALTTVIELLACSRVHASDEVATALGLRRGIQVYSIKRLIRVGADAFGVEEICVPSDQFEGLDARRIKQAGGNPRGVFLKQFGLRLLEGTPRLRTVLAEREVARLLQLEVDFPLLESIRVAQTLDGRKIEWSRLLCRTDRYAYRPKCDA